MIKRFSTLPLVRAALSVVLLASCHLATANLVRNGAFSEPGAVTAPTPPISRPDNRIPSWAMRAEWHVDTTQASPLNGAQVLRVDGAHNSAQLYQYVYLEPGKTYTLSAWIKGQNINAAAARGESRASVLVTDWRWTASFRINLEGKDLSEWQRYEVSFVAPPEYQVGGIVQPCIVRVFMPRAEKGTLWVTGIQVEEGNSAGEFEFISSTQRKDMLDQVEKLSARLSVARKNVEGFEGGSKVQALEQIDALVASLAEQDAGTDLKGKAATAHWEKLEQSLEQAVVDARQYTEPSGWWADAWSNVALRGLPERATAFEDNEVRITRAVNDYGALLLAIANLSGDSIPVEVKVGEETAALSTLSAFTGPIKVSTIYWVSNAGYVSTLSPSKEHQSFPYFLQPLPGSNSTLLPSNETTQLWFDVDTTGMKPGTYRYPVALVGHNREYRWEGTIVLTVLPVELPQKVPTNVMAYAAMPYYMEPFSPFNRQKSIVNFTPEQRKEIAGPWLDAWRDMGFNRMMLTNQFVEYSFDAEGNLAAPVNYEVFDAYLDLFREIADNFWAGYHLAAYHVFPNWRDSAKAKYDAVERTRTESVLRSFVDHAKSKGLTPESMPISLYDEPHGYRIDVTRQGADALKKIDPAWKTIAAVAGRERSQVEKLLPLLDIFVVRQRMGQMDMTPETIRYLKSKGKEVWGYACSGSFEYLHPYRYFRLLPWQAWSNDLSGYALFMTILHEEYPNIGARSSFFSPLFLGRDGPVIGRGARGFQLGGRDWAVFTLAKEEMELQKQNGGETQTLQRLLTASVRAVLSDEDNTALADQVRSDLLMEIHRLQSAREGSR